MQSAMPPFLNLQGQEEITKGKSIWGKEGFYLFFFSKSGRLYSLPEGVQFISYLLVKQLHSSYSTARCLWSRSSGSAPITYVILFTSLGVPSNHPHRKMRMRSDENLIKPQTGLAFLSPLGHLLFLGQAPNALTILHLELVALAFLLLRPTFTLVLLY